MMSAAETIFVATAGVVVLAATLAVAVAFFLARFHFGGYIRRKHPDIWRRLVPRDRYLEELVSRISFDATREMAEFRATAGTDLGDPEVARRRALAKRAERVAIVLWVCGVAWIVLGAILIALFHGD